MQSQGPCAEPQEGLVLQYFQQIPTIMLCHTAGSGFPAWHGKQPPPPAPPPPLTLAGGPGVQTWDTQGGSRAMHNFKYHAGNVTHVAFGSALAPRKAPPPPPADVSGGGTALSNGECVCNAAFRDGRGGREAPTRLLVSSRPRALPDRVNDDRWGNCKACTHARPLPLRHKPSRPALTHVLQPTLPPQGEASASAAEPDARALAAAERERRKILLLSYDERGLTCVWDVWGNGLLHCIDRSQGAALHGSMLYWLQVGWRLTRVVDVFGWLREDAGFARCSGVVVAEGVS